MKKMSESKKKRLLEWLKRQPKKDKGRNTKPAMTNKYGKVIQLNKEIK
tara:strand:+ start:870 stop:1013 length:144 start_codon:yes stop_codon:yes gene_type:complete